MLNYQRVSLNSMDRAEASQTYQDWQQRWTPSQAVASAMQDTQIFDRNYMGGFINGGSPIAGWFIS